MSRLKTEAAHSIFRARSAAITIEYCPILKGVVVVRFHRRSGLQSRRKASSDQRF